MHKVAFSLTLSSSLFHPPQRGEEKHVIVHLCSQQHLAHAKSRFQLRARRTIEMSLLPNKDGSPRN
jgi:hypothetical protein